MNVQDIVTERYAAAALTPEPALCCPVDYDPKLLALLPREILEKDYGCGDPSRHVRPGDTVLDLGSGSGKICYIAAQLVGPQGFVIGVDMNDAMLALARKHQGEMARRLGGERVRFVKARIQDLAHDLEASGAPAITDASVDLVISNCVLNLVGEAERAQMILEIHRVLRPGGRVAISDIVCDEPVPAALKQDPALWSGCVSGAFQERAFLEAFATAGFCAVRYDKWEARPWKVVAGIEFRSVTLTAVKADPAPCLDRGHAVIYRGPYASVSDDEGHVFPRGLRMAVCERSYRFLTEGPLRNDFIGIPPAVPRDPPVPWCMPAGTVRPPAESKGAAHTAACCDGGGGSCC